MKAGPAVDWTRPEVWEFFPLDDEAPAVRERDDGLDAACEGARDDTRDGAVGEGPDELPGDDAPGFVETAPAVDLR